MQGRVFTTVIAAVSIACTCAFSDESISLSDYTCAQFLSDTGKPDQGNKVVRSLMMVAWATGFAAAHQRNAIRADDGAMQVIAANLASVCRKQPTSSAAQVIASAISQIADSEFVQTAAKVSSEEDNVRLQVGQQMPPQTKERSQTDVTERQAALTPSAVSNGAFRTFDNFDMFGGDLRKIQKVELKTCAAACLADRQCRGYSFDRWNRYCYLKSTVNALTFDPSSTTGLRANIDDPGYSKVEYRIDRRANKSLEGSNSVKVGISGVEDCDRSCAADKACFGFTFEKPRSVCRMFSAINTFKPDRSATSGIKTQSPP
jgi:hypothetical protein